MNGGVTEQFHDPFFSTSPTLNLCISFAIDYIVYNTSNRFGHQFEAFSDEREALLTNGGQCKGQNHPSDEYVSIILRLSISVQ